MIRKFNPRWSDVRPSMALHIPRNVVRGHLKKLGEIVENLQVDLAEAAAAERRARRTRRKP